MVPCEEEVGPDLLVGGQEVHGGTAEFRMEVSVVDTTRVLVDPGGCVLLPGVSGYEPVVTAVAGVVEVRVVPLSGELGELCEKVYLPRGYVGGVYCGVVTRELFYNLYVVGVRNVVVVTDELGVGDITRTVYVGHVPPGIMVHTFQMVCAVVAVSLLASVGKLPWLVIGLMLVVLSTYFTYCVRFWLAAFRYF
jgi:hypothetical protein